MKRIASALLVFLLLLSLGGCGSQEALELCQRTVSSMQAAGGATFNLRITLAGQGDPQIIGGACRVENLFQSDMRAQLNLQRYYLHTIDTSWTGKTGTQTIRSVQEDRPVTYSSGTVYFGYGNTRLSLHDNELINAAKAFALPAEGLRDVKLTANGDKTTIAFAVVDGSALAGQTHQLLVGFLEMTLEPQRLEGTLTLDSAGRLESLTVTFHTEVENFGPTDYTIFLDVISYGEVAPVYPPDNPNAYRSR